MNDWLRGKDTISYMRGMEIFENHTPVQSANSILPPLDNYTQAKKTKVLVFMKARSQSDRQDHTETR